MGFCGDFRQFPNMWEWLDAVIPVRVGYLGRFVNEYIQSKKGAAVVLAQ